MRNKALSYIVAVTLGTVIVSGQVAWGLVMSGATYNAAAIPVSAAPHDGDINGYPDENAAVNGKYQSLYAYDGNGDYYWYLGDGREQGSVSTAPELDLETSTVCIYTVEYRGMFQNDPFLDSGWIKNDISCEGYDDNGDYSYTIVHRSDPRYRGNPAWSIWEDWEYHVQADAFRGGLIRPEKFVSR